MGTSGISQGGGHKTEFKLCGAAYQKNEFQPAEDIDIYKAAPLDSDEVYKEPEVQEVKTGTICFRGLLR